MPSCEDCYFGRNLLCALPEPQPCATFRPNHPDGLRPPQQLRFVFRSERRTRAVWAFPSAACSCALGKAQTAGASRAARLIRRRLAATDRGHPNRAGVGGARYCLGVCALYSCGVRCR